MNERATPNEEAGREHVGKYTDAEGPEHESDLTPNDEERATRADSDGEAGSSGA